MAAEFVVAAVVVAPNGGFLERPVDPFDLAVRPRVIGLCQAVLDVVLGTSKFAVLFGERFTKAMA